MLDLMRSHAATIVTRPIARAASPSRLLNALARRPGAILLDSSAAHDLWGRYTIAACRPLCTLTAQNGLLTETPGEDSLVLPRRSTTSHPSRPPMRWDRTGLTESLTSALRRVLGCVQARPVKDCQYPPGWIGYLGYELGGYFERLPARTKRNTILPDMHLAFYDAVAVHDSLTGQWQMATLQFDDPPDGAGRAERELLASLAEAEPPDAGFNEASGVPGTDAFDERTGVRSNFTPEQYRRAVARCIEYIAAGDIFQVNLSQRFVQPTSATPAAIYARLRQRNPAWYSAYLAGDGWAVLSSSPELFLRCRGRHVITRPIKGTRRRIGNPDADRSAAAELLASGKDNAELAMIIDLLRNDLGRVCQYGSVRVTDGRTLETHPTVFHLVGTVEGILHEDRDIADLIRASFPGGSITGAPKIRAMEIIDEIEPSARGVYTGSIAHFGVDSSAELSIVIRTAVWESGRIHVHAGGGIVADSTPEAEYTETLDKARAVLEAIAAAEHRGATNTP